MKLEKLWIENYNQYKETWILFDTDSKEMSFQKEIFGKMNFTLFSGENGSGKTTVLSFVALTFRYLQRFRERMPSDFIIEYLTNVEGKRHRVSLSMYHKDVYISLDDGEKKYVQEYDQEKKKYIVRKEIENAQVTYDSIAKYLPSTVYVMGFDTMYQKLTYNPNYIGDRRVDYRDISASYIDTNRGTYNSSGILYLYYKLSTRPGLKKMLKTWGINLAPYVDVKINVLDEQHDTNPYSYKYREMTPMIYERNLSLYKESNLEQYIQKTDGYNDRFYISDYLRNRRNVEFLNQLIQQRIVYINEYYIRKDNGDIPINGMSTGEKIFLYDLFSLCATVRDNALVIWEEPETHLNILWAKNLIPVLVELFKTKDVHILLSSHSPYMIKNLFQDQIVRLKDGNNYHPGFNTFMANDVEICRKLFDDINTSSFEDAVIKYMKTAPERHDDLFDVLGESYLKFLLYKLVEK